MDIEAMEGPVWLERMRRWVRWMGGGEVRVTDSMRRRDAARSLKLTVERTTALGVDRDLCLQASKINAAHSGLCG